MAWWCNGYDVGPATQRVAVWLPAVPLSGNNLKQVVHTHVPLSPCSVNWYRSKVVMPYGWADNCRSDVTLAMCHRLQWFVHLWAQWHRFTFILLFHCEHCTFSKVDFMFIKLLSLINFQGQREKISTSSRAMWLPWDISQCCVCLIYCCSMEKCLPISRWDNDGENLPKYFNLSKED